jgi:citrate lyase subunit beta/citryl-CoA lyase
MLTPPRSFLFIPGHRETMLAKAATCGADAVVLDLEDSVPPAEKDAARARVEHLLHTWPTDHAPQPFVRINPPRSGQLADDLKTVLAHPETGVVVPKVDHPLELAAVREGVGQRPLIINVETPRSLLHAEEFAEAPGVDGLFLGGEDLTAALGTRRTPESRELDIPRFLLLAAARSAGIFAWDTINPEFRDLELLMRDCRAAASMGFDGKFAIHPAQIAVIHEAFMPSQVEIDRARQIVVAYDAAIARGDGAVAVEGQMVDPPVALRAQAVLQRAARS